MAAKRRLSVSGRSTGASEETMQEDAALDQRLAILEDVTTAHDRAITAGQQNAAILQRMMEGHVEVAGWGTETWEFWEDWNTLAEADTLAELIKSGSLVRMNDSYPQKVVLELFKTSTVPEVVKSLRKDAQYHGLNLSITSFQVGSKVIKKLPRMVYHRLSTKLQDIGGNANECVQSILPRNATNPEFQHKMLDSEGTILATGRVEILHAGYDARVMRVRLLEKYSKDGWDLDLSTLRTTLEAEFTTQLKTYPLPVELDLVTVVEPLPERRSEEPAVAANAGIGGGGVGGGEAQTGKGKGGKENKGKGKGKKGKGKTVKGKTGKARAKGIFGK